MLPNNNATGTISALHRYVSLVFRFVNIEMTKLLIGCFFLHVPIIIPLLERLIFKSLTDLTHLVSLLCDLKFLSYSGFFELKTIIVGSYFTLSHLFQNTFVRYCIFNQ